MHNHPLFILGGDHHNTLGVIRAMGARGFRPCVVVLSEEDDTCVSRSRYIGRFIRISEVKQLVPCLMELIPDSGPKPVVICCHDAMASEIDVHATRLGRHFIIPGANKDGAITELMDKELMGKLAAQCGLHVPVKDAFPCIIKPRKTIIGSKDWIHICRTPDNLASFEKEYGAQNLLVQKFIDKVAEFQLIGCSLADGGLIIPGVSSILRPCQGSNTSFLRYSGPDTMVDIDKVKRFVKETGYVGLFSVEFVRDQDGTDYFLEINFRNDGNAVCVTVAGMNLPYIWYLSSIGEDFSAEINKSIKTVFVVPEFEELSLLFSRQITLREFISDCLKADAGMEFDWKDQKPFWHKLRMRVINKLKNSHAS